MALARNNPDGAQVDVCDLCRPVHFAFTPIERTVEIMHRPCPDCLSFDNRSQHLCSLCQHWRFRHLINCLSHSEARPIGGKYRCIIGARDKHKLSKGCAVCDMVYFASEIKAKYLRGTKRDTYPTMFIARDEILYKHIAVDDRHHDVSYLRLYTTTNVPDCVQPEIHWSRINNWLMKCAKSHDKCHRQYFKQPDEIRLIDVKRRKLVRANGNNRFVALSYVWGTNRILERLTCTKRNVRELEQDGALKAERLPQTIEDALQVCKLLGEQYLWVDRLCIVQDDSSQKHGQIQAMAKIFSSASLVIVVLDGDMETGIPGILPRPGTQKQVEANGVVFMNELPNAQDIIDHSDWATRGWTYQEAALSRRALYFSWVQVFLQCNTDLKTEDVTVQEKKRRKHGSFLLEHDWSFSRWHRHLWRYTARSLSYQSDIYNAIAGISNALLPEPASWLYGLPRRDFDEALLWLSDLSLGWRISDEVLLPRWSWSAVKGRIEHQTAPNSDDNYDRFHKRPAFIGTAVAWNYQEEHDASPLKFIPVRDSKSAACAEPVAFDCRLIYSEENLSEDNKRFFLGLPSNGQRIYQASFYDRSPKLLCYGIAWSQGCIDVDWPFPALSERTFQELGADLEQHWQEPHYLEREIIFRACQERETLILEIDTPLHRSTLKGRTQTSFFALEENYREKNDKRKNDTSRPKHLVTIIDNKGKPAGQIDGLEEEKAKILLQCEASCKYQLIALAIGYFRKPEVIREIYGDFLSDNPVTGRWWDDVLRYGRTYQPLTQAEVSRYCEAVGPNGLDISYLDSEGSALSFFPIVHVMLAEWDGPVARRIAIGWVYLTKWVQSNPQFKTVYLA